MEALVWEMLNQTMPEGPQQQFDRIFAWTLFGLWALVNAWFVLRICRTHGRRTRDPRLLSDTLGLPELAELSVRMPTGRLSPAPVGVHPRRATPKGDLRSPRAQRPAPASPALSSPTAQTATSLTPVEAMELTPADDP